MTPRERDLAALRERRECPALIIGGGIVGIGVLRELALRGMPAILIERADFCAGASGASSRLLHGGLRYLEYGEFRLVREALRERDGLLANAPHAATPLRINLPLFATWSGLANAPLRFLGLRNQPAARGALVARIGLTLYDVFARRRRRLPGHRFFGRRQARQKWPKLNADVRAIAHYADGFMPQPERIALDLLADAREYPAAALAINHLALARLAGDQVILRDSLDGEEFSLRPALVLNATGAWIDAANGRLRAPTRYIGGTRGSHLILRHDELHAELAGEMFYFEFADGRLLLCYPLAGRVLVGTTDLRCEEPDEAVCDEEEAEYLLSALRWLFPAMRFASEDIAHRYCGVRPLPAAPGTTAAAGATAAISRDHHLQELPATAERPFPIASLIGGKWTNFRAFSELAARWAMARLGAVFHGSSVNLAIGGGRDFPADAAARAVWLREIAAATGHDALWLGRWLARYGTRAAELARATPPASAAPLANAPAYARNELAWLALEERAGRLDDLLLRRTLLPISDDITPALLTELAEIQGAALSWSAARRDEEVERASRILRERHGHDI